MRAALAIACAALVGCSSTDERPIERVDVSDVYVAFRDNPAAAEQRFAAVRLQVTGKVDSVEPGASGPELFLTAPHGGIMSVDLPAEAADQVAALRQGQAVTVTCGGVHKMPTDQVFDLKACAL